MNVLNLLTIGVALGQVEITIEMIVISIIVLVILVGLISFRRNYRAQMQVSQFMDVETDIYNANGFEIYLKKHKKIANPTLVVIELKNLAYLYSSYQNKGYLLEIIADIMLRGLKKEESISRIEFNKFVILFSGRSKEEIKGIISGIDSRLDELVIPSYGKYDFTLNAGIYDRPNLSDPKFAIISTISILSYSKIKEGNISYYSDDVEKNITRLKQINELKTSALEQKKFVSYIQPKVSFRTGKVIGGEILARWVDENQNFIYYPNEFIPLFEANGFIKELDMLMLNNACALAQSMVLRGNNDIVISCNISKVLFNSSNFVRTIMDIVSKYQISPKNIEIEITETTVMENLQHVSNCIMELRQMGFEVAMDDFGKEYSSLGSLSQNPFDTIKLDMVFFRDRLSTEKSKNIVANLLNMLSKLNYHIVCEGIEDKQTLDVLATLNRDIIIQGYVFSKPIPVSQFEAFAATTFEFDYPDYNEIANAQASSQTVVNEKPISKPENSEIEDMKKQMLEMQELFRKSLEEQKQQAYENEMNSLRSQVESMRNMATQPKKDYRDETLDSLRREIEMLKKGTVEEPIDPREREINELKRQIDELKNQKTTQQLNVDDLVAKITQAQQQKTSDELRHELERERKEKLELERILQQMEDESSDLSDEEIEKEQELANKNLNLDIDSLSDDDSDDDSEDDDETPEKIEKPQYTLEELEGVIQKYMEKYNSQWNQKAKEELKDGYYEIINGLKYYRGKVYFNFNDRMKRASDEVKQLYNIAKNELLQYSGITNKTLNSYDCFYNGKKLIAKLSMTKRSVRVYLALDPSQYSERQFPHRDVSSKKVHAKTPYFMMIKSKLSVKRMKMLIDDMMLNEKTKLNEEYSPVDYAAKFKYTKNK